MSSILEQQLDDMLARADADPYYADIYLSILRPRGSEGFAEIDSKIEAALAGLRKKGGKVGAAVTFLMPIGDTEKPNVSGPQMRFIYTARVQEIVPINMGPSGTQKSAEEIALHTLGLFHLSMLNGGNCLYADQNTLTPSDQFAPRLTYDVRLRMQGNLRPPTKVALPIIAPRGGSIADPVTLSCPTAGATIWYTTDGSYPSSAGGAAQYSSPLTLTEACTLRVAAEKADYQQSDVNQAAFV